MARRPRRVPGHQAQARRVGPRPRIAEERQTLARRAWMKVACVRRSLFVARYRDALLRHDDPGGLVRVERTVIVVGADGVERYAVAISTGGACRIDGAGIEYAGVCGRM